MTYVSEHDEVPGDLVIIGVPVDSVGAARPGDVRLGCELAPAVLRSAGVAAAIGAGDEGDLPVRIVGRERDRETGMIGWPSVAETSAAIRARVAGMLGDGKLPVLLGGCCAVMPGALAGARDVIGPLGLAYVDGHLDLYDNTTSPTGEAADMAVAVISGLGPAPWCEQVGAPLTAPERVALLGPADREEAASLASRMPEELGIPAELSPAEIRAGGAASAGKQARIQVGERYWVHVDVDVLDHREFPSTDYPNASGLAVAELGDLLPPLTSSPGMIGFSLAGYNPQKDPDGGCGRRLTGLLGTVLSPAAR